MKLSNLFLINENVQLADKVYFKTGLLSNKVREIMISKITNGDALTKKMCDLYHAELQNDLRVGEWAINHISDESFKEKDIYETDNDWNNLTRWKEIKNIYNELKSYNKNVFPIKDYDIKDRRSILVFIRGIRQRRLILNEFDKLPSVAKRNMKVDIKQIRDGHEMNEYRDKLEHFMNHYSLLSNRSEELKQNVIRKMFKSNTTLDELLNFVEEKENLIGGADLTDNEIEKIIKEHHIDVVYRNGDYLILEVNEVEAIKDLGCNSLWCFTYNRKDGGVNYSDWSMYSHNNIVYVFIDFSLPSDDKEFMCVLVNPLDFFPVEEDDNHNKMFYMDNNEVYNPLNIIDEFIGLEKGRKLLSFGLDPQPKPKLKFKDPNQMELKFEMKLNKLYNQVLVEELSYRHSNSLGVEDDEYEIGIVKEGVNKVILYHGSQRELNEKQGFSTKFILSGEGNNIFGWGLYFTDVIEVAKSYARNNASNEYNRLLSLANDMVGNDVDEVIELFYSQGEWDNLPKEFRNLLLKNKGGTTDNLINYGYLYTVELHPSKPKVFNWYDTLNPKEFGVDSNSMSGKDIYKYLVTKLGSEESASKFLYEKGYYGITYPTGTLSGDHGYEQGLNYVIFNEKDIRISNIKKL